MLGTDLLLVRGADQSTVHHATKIEECFHLPSWLCSMSSLLENQKINVAFKQAEPSFSRPMSLTIVSNCRLIGLM
ncbi:unnamed protein product, partial [Brenthis ino]